ncbi:TPA: multiubiquitin domain-containing protein [Pseudomonas aeruginosa]|nr:multiubiquitin domain-containing protein [Pseudomonas aeruginosa]HBO4702830.1 multiubiquitin domain-containing protein [Pseudomonas aeruginosa]
MNKKADEPIFVAGLDFEFHAVDVIDETPTGNQIAFAAGFKPDRLATVIQVLPSGVFEDISPEEVVNLSSSSRRFLVVETDRLYYFAVDGLRYEWPCKVINGATVRKIANVDQELRLLQQREDEPDRELADGDTVNLAEEGIERFLSRKAKWKLKVQGVPFEFDKYAVTVREAAERAGIDLSLEWTITFTVAGNNSQDVTINDTLDLRTPGIEKLRFTPKDVGNGEMAAPRRAFNMLPVDVAYLNQLGLRWETCLGTDGSRYLLLHDYELPAGYSHQQVQIALLVLPGYPVEPMDSFYVFPHVSLLSGVSIPNLGMTAQIDGVAFQGWSRHRTTTPWNPNADNVISQLALVDGCLHREIGQ